MDSPRKHPGNDHGNKKADDRSDEKHL
jgi:hypothetical protein